MLKLRLRWEHGTKLALAAALTASMMALVVALSEITLRFWPPRKGADLVWTEADRIQTEETALRQILRIRRASAGSVGNNDVVIRATDRTAAEPVYGGLPNQREIAEINERLRRLEKAEAEAATRGGSSEPADIAADLTRLSELRQRFSKTIRHDWDFPARMTVKEWSTVSVRLIPIPAAPIPAAEKGRQRETNQGPVTVRARAVIKIEGEAKVEPPLFEMQTISTTEPTEWRWRVMPQTGKALRVVVAIENSLPDGESSVPFMGLAETRDIEVETPLLVRVGQFFALVGMLWNGLIGILVPISALLGPVTAWAVFKDRLFPSKEPAPAPTGWPPMDAAGAGTTYLFALHRIMLAGG